MTDDKEEGKPITATELKQDDLAEFIRYYKTRVDGARALFYGGREAPEGTVGLRSPPNAKAVKQWLVDLNHTVTWDDVIGAEVAKDALRSAIEDATKDPELYKFYGMSPPRGLLLYGPPGNGKTLLAKATARALAHTYGAEEAKMILIKGPELQSKWFGETEANIRAIFAYAREYAAYAGHPLVVFMDEADALLGQRGDGYRFRDEIVAQFLAEMDGLQSSSAFVILATNRPDELDEALLRDGRVDRKIKVGRIIREDVLRLLNYELNKGATTWSGTGVNVPAVVEAIFDPTLTIRVMTNPESGASHHFNFEHIISGALVVGLVKRAKTLAFARDRANRDQIGVLTGDLIAAVTQSFEEEKLLVHREALDEFIQETALPAERKLKERNWN